MEIILNLKGEKGKSMIKPFLINYPIGLTIFVIIFTICLLFFMNKFSCAKTKKGAFTIGLFFLALSTIGAFFVNIKSINEKIEEKSQQAIEKMTPCTIIKVKDEGQNITGKIYCHPDLQIISSKKLEQDLAITYIEIIISIFYASIGGNLIASALVRDK